MSLVGLRGVEGGHTQMGVAGLARVAVAAFEQRGRVHVLLGEHVVDVADLLDERLRVDAVLLVVGDLPHTATVGLVDGLAHRVGSLVGVHDDRARYVAGRATDGLDQRAVRAQEPLLVGVEDGHQRYLGQVQSLSQQVDAYDDVDLAFAQFAQQFDAPQRVDVGMQVFDLDAAFQQVVGQILGHLLGQCRHQRALVFVDAVLDLGEQVVDLPLGRAHVDLLDHAVRQTELIVAGRRRQVYGLPDAVQELRPFERAVVHRGRQTEPMFDQRALAGRVSLVHRADLRHGDMRLVDDQQEVIREEVEQRVRRRAGCAVVEMPRIVLHA